MAGFNFGPLLGGVTNVVAAFQKSKGVKSFLEHVNEYGIQTKNNFEVNFSGFPNASFFISSITLPGVKQEYSDAFYNGRTIRVPIVYDTEKDVSMSFINDAKGYLYPLIKEFIMKEATNKLISSGLTVIVKGLSGDGNYNGIQITLTGVRFQSITGLSFGQNDNDVSTFDVILNCTDFSVTNNGIMSKVSNILGAANSILG